VIFLAHSTTQATNALLEGDVASVGVIGMSTRVESLLARSQSAMKPIELAPGRFMKPANRFLMKETLTDETIRQGDRGIAGRKAQRSLSRASPWLSTTTRPRKRCAVSWSMPG
jgi:hypothetical protein